MQPNDWLIEFEKSARETDKFSNHPNRVHLLAAGLMGEAGSMLSELKKMEREKAAYPINRRRMTEEVGDFLWYFVRLVEQVDQALLEELVKNDNTLDGASSNSPVPPVYLDFGSIVGGILEKVKTFKIGDNAPDLRESLIRCWNILNRVAEVSKTPLKGAADGNIKKTHGRWPEKKIYIDLFDESYPIEEQIPRKLTIEFIERDYQRSGKKIVVLKCNGLNFGDRLSDNIQDPDCYRFHDIFHFAYAVHLGWSPILRALLRIKRKSEPEVDEGEDGARAGIIEEAVSATVFAYAKQLSFFDGIDHVDYDLLKIVKNFTEGYEVEKAPLWQWEKAIIDGFSLFRQLRDKKGGIVHLNLIERTLTFSEHEK